MNRARFINWFAWDKSSWQAASRISFHSRESERFAASRRSGALVFAILILFAGCNAKQQSKSNSSSNTQTRRIVAASYALQYLTQRIAGDEFTVEFPAASALNPREWKPSVDQIASMQAADLIVINGTGAKYANWLVQTTLPASKICSSCEDIKLKDLISVPDHQIIHTHGPEGEHSHVYMVPYTWLDPAMAIQQAKTISSRMEKVYPDLAADFQENLKGLVFDLNEIASRIPENKGARKSAVSTSPHMKYLTRAIGMKDKHLLWFEFPSDSRWGDAKKKLETKVAESSATAVIVESMPGPTAQLYFSNKGLKLVQVNLFDRCPESGDFLSATRENINRLVGLN